MSDVSDAASSETRDDRIVRVVFLCEEEEISSLIVTHCDVPHVKTVVHRLSAISELSEEKATNPDVLIIEISKKCDAESLFGIKARHALSECEIVVLCSHEEADHWQEVVLREEISDYFISRPLVDPGYLRVQIWRAIERSAMKSKKDTDEKEDNGDGDAGEPAPTGRSTAWKGTGSPAFPGKRALVIEDDMASAELLVDMLRAEGLQVNRARSVKDAYAHYASRSFDVLLLDLMMPGISGASAVKAVRKKLNHPDGPLIVTTAYSEHSLVEECLRAGATDYLIKPITRRKLFPRISKALGLPWEGSA